MLVLRQGDEEGLGKALQSIALISHLRGLRLSGPFLIVVPVDALSNCEWPRSVGGGGGGVTGYRGAAVENTVGLARTPTKQFYLGI